MGEGSWEGCGGERKLNGMRTVNFVSVWSSHIISVSFNLECGRLAVSPSLSLPLPPPLYFYFLNLVSVFFIVAIVIIVVFLSLNDPKYFAFFPPVVFHCYAQCCFISRGTSRVVTKTAL